MGLVLIGLLAVGVLPVLAQAASGSVAGSVKDQQNSVIPGATVSLVSATKGTSTETTTNAQGDFTFTNVAGDTYAIKVTMDGFKTLERPNVPVSPGDHVVVPGLVIEVGALNETVTVTGDAPMIQASTGDRSFVVTTEAVQNLPVANRNFANLASIAPGVVGTTRLGGGGQNNFQIDGISIMDTGNNGQMLQTNVEAIAEVKVVTQGYAAEYGRSSGLQISGVTKSGSNQLHGSVYDVQRHSRWDTNSWSNDKNGIAKALSDQHDRGYTFGGPIGKPGGQNKLFFFYAHEYRPRVAGGNVNRFRVPTLLERQGDFSASTDKNGVLVNLIKDPSSTSPCTSSNQAGCFADQGVLGKIPANRLYAQGIAILNLWPAPNATGTDYNLQLIAPTDKRLTQQPTVRVDYQLSAKLRLTAKYTGQRATVKVSPGSIPGFNDTLSKFPFITNYSATADWALSPSMVVEANWGFIRNQLGTPPTNPASNRCNDGLCDLPFLYADAGIVNPDYYQKQVLDAINPPFYVGGRLLLPPTFSWGSQLANLPPNITYPSFLNINRTNDVSISATKLAGRHTAKGGLLSEPQLQGAELRHRRIDAVPGQHRFLERHEQSAEHRVYVRERGAGGVHELRAAVQARRRQLPVQQHRGVYPGQLEGQQPADAGLRHPVHASAAAIRSVPAGVEFLQRSVEGRQRAVVVCGGMSDDQPLLGRQPRGGQSGDGRDAGRQQRGGHRHGHHEHRQPDRRHHSGR